MKNSTPNSKNQQSDYDTGLACLINIGLLFNVRIDVDFLRHKLVLGEKKISSLEIIKGAKLYGLKSRIVKLSAKNFYKMPTPLMMHEKDGDFAVLLSVNKERGEALIFDVRLNQAKKIKFDKLGKVWDGEAILFTQRSQDKANLKFNLKWFLPTILKYKKYLVEVLLATLFLQILGLIAPFITQVVIDKALSHNSVSTLDVLMVGLISVAVFELVMTVIKNYIFVHTTSKIDVILSARLFNHLFNLPMRYFETRRTGDTMARVMELEKIRSFLTGASLSSVIDVSFVVVYLAVMFMYSASLSWLVVASLPVFVVLSAIATPLLRNLLEEKVNAGAESQSALVENINGVQTIKSFALEPISQKKWENLQANYTKANYKMAIASNSVGVLAQAIQRIFDVAVLWAGAHLVMKGELTIGALIAFRMIASRVSGPILRLVQNWQELQQVSVSLKRIGDIFNAKPESLLLNQKARKNYVDGKINFQNVNFRYGIDDNLVIKNMSFEIAPGEVIGIVGRSGSGKSTISKLIQRLYPLDSGKIMIDDIDLSVADLSWLRRQVGIVMQENFMFNLSIRENIAIGNPNVALDEIIEASKTAGAHEFIAELPDGYETIIGERGVGLSGGQKQRLAIARALLHNPSVLIFDEATSALDYESENIIQQNLKKITAGRTVLMIAHRLSTLRNVDKIMVVDKGEIVEFDKPEILLKQNGLFKYLHDQQEKKDV